MILMPYNLITFFNEAESLIKRGELFKKKKKRKEKPRMGSLASHNSKSRFNI